MTRESLTTELALSIGDVLNEHDVPETLIDGTACNLIAAHLVASLGLESALDAPLEVEDVA